MHDLSALELNEANQDESLEATEWEYGEAEAEDEGEEPELDETDELEAAARLLSVASETELDEFLGDIIRKAAGAINRGVKAATGNSLGGLLKGIARKALPMVATALGGPLGGMAAGSIDNALKAFGLELETLSEEDQELEVARRYVRLAHGAANRALRQPIRRHPRAQARSAVRWALRRHAPGLYRAYAQPARYRGPWRRPYYPHPGYRPSGYPYDDWGRGLDVFPAAPPPPVLCSQCAAAVAAPPPPAPEEPANEPAAAATAPQTGNTSEIENEDNEYGAPYSVHGRHPHSGHWVRRGRSIVLYGV